jgi:GDP-L-fucose synthase
MKILITGASGMVGRELSLLFPNAWIPSSSDLDLENPQAVFTYLNQNKFDYVIHLAAYVGSLHDNIKNSTLYFDKNIIMNTILTKASYDSGVKNFLGILSTCIYPDNISKFPIVEKDLHNGKPHKDLMSYAYSKRSHAVQLDEYKKSFGVNYNYLIPCNMYGNVKHAGRAHYVNDLIYKISNAKKLQKNYITLFGDGTPLRQFMHAKDFAKIIFLHVESNIQDSYNVAPDENFSVHEMANMALEVTNSLHIEIKYDDSLPNGQHRKDVSNIKMKSHFKDFKFLELKNGMKKIYELHE